MSKPKAAVDQPDAVVTSEDGRRWHVFCVLCPRTLGKDLSRKADAVVFAHEHLEHSHGVVRVFVECHRPGYREAVNAALPLVVAHDLTLPADRYTQ